MNGMPPTAKGIAATSRLSAGQNKGLSGEKNFRFSYRTPLRSLKKIRGGGLPLRGPPPEAVLGASLQVSHGRGNGVEGRLQGLPLWETTPERLPSSDAGLLRPGPVLDDGQDDLFLHFLFLLDGLFWTA